MLSATADCATTLADGHSARGWKTSPLRSTSAANPREAKQKERTYSAARPIHQHSAHLHTPLQLMLMHYKHSRGMSNSSSYNPSSQTMQFATLCHQKQVITPKCTAKQNHSSSSLLLLDAAASFSSKAAWSVLCRRSSCALGTLVFLPFRTGTLEL